MKPRTANGMPHQLVHLKYGSLIAFLLAMYKSWKALAFI
jgi:hypothetical protein